MRLLNVAGIFVSMETRFVPSMEPVEAAAALSVTPTFDFLILAPRTTKLTTPYFTPPTGNSCDPRASQDVGRPDGAASSSVFFSFSPALRSLYTVSLIVLHPFLPPLTQETKIGVTVGSLRQNSDSKEVKTLAKAIVKKWRSSVGPVGTKKEQASKEQSSSFSQPRP